jgi:hypothetical protein
MAASTTTESSLSVPTTRHCAFCLEESSNMKTCGGCKKRAYCSVQCQRKDWGETGQCHRMWCKADCGEEDIDWKVQEIEGKGLGLIALKDIAPLSKIIVDRSYEWDEIKDSPQLADLCPKNGTMTEKFGLNAISHNGTSELNFRISRLNHSCQSNASSQRIRETKVRLIYSRQLIRRGEEITIPYLSFLSEIETKYKDPAQYLKLVCENLEKKWGIICPPQCVCKDPATLTFVVDLQRSYEIVKRSGSMRRFKTTFEEAKKMIKLFNTDPKLIGMYTYKLSPLIDAYQAAFATRDKKAQAEGLEYMKEFVRIMEAIEHPGSSYITSARFHLNTPHDPQKRFTREFNQFLRNFT